MAFDNVRLPEQIVDAACVGDLQTDLARAQDDLGRAESAHGDADHFGRSATAKARPSASSFSAVGTPSRVQPRAS